MSKKDLPVGTYKGEPEDFIVQERLWDGNGVAYPLSLSTESLVFGYDPNFPVTVFCMSKVGWGTEDAVKEVSRKLKVPFGNVQYQGLKDKRARTSQLISVRPVRGSLLSGFQHDDICLVQMYGQYEDLKRGRGFDGNHFTIKIYSDVTNLDLSAVEQIHNIWGPQRLGRPGSEEIGRALLEARYDAAIDLLLDKRGSRKGAEDLRRARAASGGTWRDALFHKEFAYNFKFEVGKWQSYLWNKLFAECVAAGNLPDRLPMWQLERDVVERYRHLWNPPDHLSPEALRVSDKQWRPTVVQPQNFQAKYVNGVWRFQFDLPPSVYATVVLSELFQLKEEFGHHD